MFLHVFTFVVFAVLIAAAVFLFVKLGTLPGQIASKRGHPQHEAIQVAGWLGVFSLGLLWPLALIWAFTKSAPGKNGGALSTQDPDIDDQCARLSGRILELEDEIKRIRAQQEERSSP